VLFCYLGFFTSWAASSRLTVSGMKRDFITLWRSLCRSAGMCLMASDVASTSEGEDGRHRARASLAVEEVRLDVPGLDEDGGDVVPKEE